MLLVGGDGRVQCSTSNTFVGVDLGDRPYIKKARSTGEIAFSEFTFVPTINMGVILAGYPVAAINKGAVAAYARPSQTLGAWSATCEARESTSDWVIELTGWSMTTGRRPCIPIARRVSSRNASEKPAARLSKSSRGQATGRSGANDPQSRGP